MAEVSRGGIGKKGGGKKGPDRRRSKSAKHRERVYAGKGAASLVEAGPTGAEGESVLGTFKNPIDSSDQGPQGYIHDLEYGQYVTHTHKCDVCNVDLVHTHRITARDGSDMFLTGPAGELCLSCASRLGQQRVTMSTPSSSILHMLHELRRAPHPGQAEAAQSVAPGPKGGKK